MGPPDEDPPSRRTLLIGSEALLGAWSEHAAGASDVIAVAHTNLEQALDAIQQTRPEVVVVEQALAGTEGGQVLMERLHNERSLRGLEISLLPPNGVDQLLSTGPGDIHPHQWLTGLARPLPPRPKRGSARTRATDAEHVLVDGHVAMLLDVSATGAQVRSSGALRPNQHVRVVLSARGSMRTPGVVVWSTLEGGRPAHYRAGIAFANPIPELEPTPQEEQKPHGSKKQKGARRPRKSR